MIPQTAAAKVHPGQQVLINFISGNAKRHEIFKGVITRLSDTLDANGNLRANVQLQNVPGVTREFDLKPNMRADAHVITQDVSILKRIWGNFFHRR